MQLTKRCLFVSTSAGSIRSQSTLEQHTVSYKHIAQLCFGLFSTTQLPITGGLTETDVGENVSSWLKTAAEAVTA